MNITYIIGNGVDLNIGLKTKYSDFYDYYKSIEYNDIENNDNVDIKDEINKLKKDICNNVDLWSDLEKRLGEYTKNIQSPYVMEKLYFDIVDRLTDYINEQVLTIPESSDEARESFLKDLASPEKYFLRTNKEKIKAFYARFSDSVSINIITLNYTPTIEKILGNNYSNVKLEEGYIKGVIPVLENIYHIHHSVDDTILLGVNDETQITNQKLSEDKKIRELIIKPETNIMNKSGVDNDCEKIIKNTNLFVFFGVSIGETDKKWWKLINACLVNTDFCRALIFEFKDGLLQSRLIGEYERNTKSKLSSQTNHSEYGLDLFNKRVFVSFKKDMFSDIKNYIHILPYQHGSFTINYSNNNGENVIGNNKRKFTTRWSKASDKSIHAYNDAQDIESIGLVHGLADYNKINLSSIDFSSRSRTAQIGDCIVWKNIYGNYAITKIKKNKG